MNEFFEDLKTAKFQYTLRESIFHTAWFTSSWWEYLLDRGGSFCRRKKYKLSIRKLYCRMRGHAGVYFYNSYGQEPDMTCKFCDDDLG